VIITNSNFASFNYFKSLVVKTSNLLNEDAKTKESYYIDKLGIKLETEVFNMLLKITKKTVLEGKIELISGFKFPDIIINTIYGLEVKSTIKESWKSTGNSILESNRVPNISKIMIIFGKLSKPISFKCDLYENCLSDIRITHSPRYQIDMNTQKTIFEKLNIAYEKFITLDNQIEIVKEFYSTRLKKGEFLWSIDSNPSSTN
jgi:hypothetical protein